MEISPNPPVLIKTRTQSIQSKAEPLPRLPVPTLEDTCERYLESVEPFLSQHEFDRTRGLVAAFASGIGRTLQQRLLARAAQPDMTNWLWEWWNESAYFGNRQPLVPYISPFASHRLNDRRRDQASRAAALTLAALRFKRMIDGGTTQYMPSSTPTCMASYQWLFHACRIPSRPSDYSTKFDRFDGQNQHIVAIHKNAFFRIDFCRGSRNLSFEELSGHFSAIVEAMRSDQAPAVGIFTTLKRDSWADIRSRLVTIGNNESSLHLIESAAFIVCLEEASPTTGNERARGFWCGSHDQCGNRWFDKPIQIIVNRNGTSGVCFEHAMLDGLAMNHFNAAIVQMAESQAQPEHHMENNLPRPERIHFELQSDILNDIANAERNFKQSISDQGLHVQVYKDYGKAFIKQRLRCPPDAFVQVAVQLAYYRLHGTFVPTYESVSTARFRLGRTDVCRPVTVEMVQFCQAIERHERNERSSSSALCTLLGKALARHTRNSTAASNGQGIDRHLLGLQKVLRTGEDAYVSNDPAFLRSSRWGLCTSQVSSEQNGAFGFAQAVDDGYGIAYMINEKNVHFTVTSRKQDCKDMGLALRKAMDDLRDFVIDAGQLPTYSRF